MFPNPWSGMNYDDLILQMRKQTKEDEELSMVLCSEAVRTETYTKGWRALKATLHCPMGIHCILLYLFVWCLPPFGAAVPNGKHQVLFIFHGPIQNLGLINNVC